MVLVLLDLVCIVPVLVVLVDCISTCTVLVPYYTVDRSRSGIDLVDLARSSILVDLDLASTAVLARILARSRRYRSMCVNSGAYLIIDRSKAVGSYGTVLVLEAVRVRRILQLQL